jgi:ribosome-associated protein
MLVQQGRIAGLPDPEQFSQPLLQRRVRDSLPRMKSSSATRPSLAAAQTAAALCLDLKANDVVILDLEGVTDMTDCFVIASGSSDTHVRAIAEHVAEEMKKRGFPAHHVEGLNQGRWALVDFVDFVVHVFHPTLRSFYQLERLWGDAAVVAVVPQGAGT